MPHQSPTESVGVGPNIDRCIIQFYRAGSEYCSEHWTEEQYQIEVKEVTALFSRLSSELLSTIPWFRDNGQSEAATILDALQLREKEKLHLVGMHVCHTRAIMVIFSHFTDSSVPGQASGSKR